MGRLNCFIFIFAIVTISNGVRINMQGSLSVGQDVLETISHYLQKNINSLSRRSAVITNKADKPAEKIRFYMQTTSLCRGTTICSGKIKDFVKEYVTILANALETVFDGILTRRSGVDSSGIFFVDQLKPVLLDINEIIKSADGRFNSSQDQIEYISIVKRISAKFQSSAVSFVNDRLNDNQQDIQAIRKKLIQRLVIATILVENRYEKLLCMSLEICQKENEVTVALHSILAEFQKAPNEKAVELVKMFYENLSESMTGFLDAETLYEFQIILSDLSYAKNSPAKEVLGSLYNAVDTRLSYLQNSTEVSKAYDQQLVYIILSDLDYFYYSSRKMYPFDKFLGRFSTWIRVGGKFNHHMIQLMRDLDKKLADQPQGLVRKLIDEIRVFLELTVDPAEA